MTTTSSTSAPTFSVSGLASGLPANLVDQLIQLQQQPLTDLANKKIQAQSVQRAWQELNSALLTMKASMESLKASSSFVGMSATSSDTTTATVSADSTAAAGRYTLTNITLAQNAQLRHTVGVASKANALTGTTFAFQYGTNAVQTVSITNGVSTLVDLQNSINNLNAGVTASIVNDGAKDYLVLTGNDTGSAKTITLQPTTNITGFSDVDFTTVSTAGNAAVTVNGLPVTSTTNAVTGAIGGVTLNLAKAISGATSVTVDVAKDSGLLKGKIQYFVDSYNKVATLLKQHTTYDKKTGARTALFGDPAIRGIETQLHQIITKKVAGLTGTYTTLPELGLTTNKQGHLQIDGAKLDAAITADSAGVAKMFYEDTTARTTGYAAQFATYLADITNSATGLLYGKTSALDAKLKLLDSQIQNTQHRVDLASTRIRQQFSSLEVLISNMNSASAGPLRTLQNMNLFPSSNNGK